MNYLTEGALMFWVSGTPKPCPRPRSYMQPRSKLPSNPVARAKLCKSRQCHTVRTYSANDDKHWRMAAQLAAADYGQLDQPYFDKKVPLFFGMIAFFQRPKGHFIGNDRSRALKKSAPKPRDKTSKPDNDNLEKAIWDSLGTTKEFPEGLLYADDAQIVENWSSKRWANDERQIGALCVVAPLLELSETQLLNNFKSPSAMSYIMAGIRG